MSPLRERALDEISMMTEDQLRVVLNLLEGLKSFAHLSSHAQDDPFYSSQNQRFIEDGMKALDAGKGVEHDLIEV